MLPMASGMSTQWLMNPGLLVKPYHNRFGIPHSQFSTDGRDSSHLRYILMETAEIILKLPIGVFYLFI